MLKPKFRIMRILLKLNFLLVLMFVVSCNNQEMNIIGRWERINTPNLKIEFTQNGIYSVEGIGAQNNLFKFNYKFLEQGPQTILSISTDSIYDTSNNIYIDFINENEIKISLNNKSELIYKRIIE